MVVDTSALIAILLGEDEAVEFARAILKDPVRLVSAFTLLETGIVIEARKGPAGAREWELLRFRAELDPVPLTASQHELALDAWRRYGKGRHEAGLNIGDCCSYSLSRMTGEALLYKGSDFALTDVASAVSG